MLSEQCVRLGFKTSDKGGVQAVFELLGDWIKTTHLLYAFSKATYNKTPEHKLSFVNSFLLYQILLNTYFSD